MLTLNDVLPGDTVELECPTLLQNICHTNKIRGVVEDVFDALLPDGKEGNLEIEIRYNQTGWLKYKPLRDGGSLTVIERKLR